MSVVVVIPVTLAIPASPAVLLAIVTAAAVRGLGLVADEFHECAEGGEADNSVELRLDNAAEAVAGASVGRKMRFKGDGVTVEFSVDENGRASVRASGRKSGDELRELGESFAKRIVQQYAYHRIVTEMRERNMNIVEEEVEADGTVRMLVRIHHG